MHKDMKSSLLKCSINCYIVTSLLDSFYFWDVFVEDLTQVHLKKKKKLLKTFSIFVDDNQLVGLLRDYGRSRSFDSIMRRVLL